MLVSFCTFQNQVSPMSLIIGKHIHKRGVCVCVHIDIDTQTNKQSKGFQVSCCCSLTKLCPTLCYHMNCSTRLPCPLLSPRVCSDSCPLSPCCCPTISSSVSRFSSCLQTSPALGFFPISWLLVSSGQSIGALASASVLLLNIQH